MLDDMGESDSAFQWIFKDVSKICQGGEMVIVHVQKFGPRNS